MIITKSIIFLKRNKKWNVVIQLTWNDLHVILTVFVMSVIRLITLCNESVLQVIQESLQLNSL